ncbi:MAG: EAL domain-containing protein [Hyphomicrobiaceae bacterium]
MIEVLSRRPPCRARERKLSCLRSYAAAALVLLAIVIATPAHALKPIVIGPDQDRIDIANQGEYYEGRGDRLQVETAPGQSEVAGRMEVKAQTAGTNPGWLVFALRNPSERSIERWLTAERYSLVGSGLVLPDLDSARITAVTPSLGFVPERVPNDQVDLFRITLEPGETVTYVVELASDNIPQLYLWKSNVYEKRLRERTLFNGIMLGITVVVALFMTALYAANHKAVFPVTAMVAWSVLAYLCIDFGFWHKLFQLSPEDNALYRSAAEASIIASLVMFLYTFLRIGSWPGWIRAFFGLWILAQLGLVLGAALDPRLAATFARGSFAIFAAVGSLLVLFQTLRLNDRGLSLAPTWILLLVWMFGAALAINGKLNNDLAVAALAGGLVLIVVMMSFAATQFAFRAPELAFAGALGDQQSRALAVDAAGAATWEWNSRRDEITTSPLVEEVLGLAQGQLSCRTDDWITHLHAGDRERFKLMLQSIQERNGGSIQMDFRMRRADGTDRWFELKAQSVAQVDQRSLRCIGLMRDVTSAKRSHQNLVHDAVHDYLTGLPNRQLFIDRLSMALVRARQENGPRPTVIFIDIDRFKNVNSDYGIIAGDSLLKNLSRRLQRHLEPQDTLARIGGDQFVMLVATEKPGQEIAMLAERVRRSLRAPIKFQGKDIVLTGSIGYSTFAGEAGTAAEELLGQAEQAMYAAKRAGTDRVEVYKPGTRPAIGQRVVLESELRRALERKQIAVLYQPIFRLANQQLVGFEALMRWQHPRLGELTPVDFLSVAQEAGLSVEIGRYVLDRAVKEAARWHKELPRPDEPLFVSVNISSRELFSADFIQELRNLLGREAVPRGTLKLEITEQLIMENPEQASELLDWLHKAGAGVAIDDFGTGYSALSYLSRFNFDTIKIDRSFLQDVKANADAALVVRSIVSLAHGLGRAIIAEGVETEEDMVFLRTIGCELVQGFLLSGPIAGRQVIEVLRGMRRDEQRGMSGGLIGRMLGSVMGRRDAEDDEPPPVPPGRPPAPPTGGGEAPRGGGDPRLSQRPPANGPPPGNGTPPPHKGPPPGAAGFQSPPTRPHATVGGPARPIVPPAEPGPTHIPRPALATLSRRPNGGPVGMPAGPDRPEARRTEPEPKPEPPVAMTPLDVLPSAASGPPPALDPALEQRIRSIFRDTALRGSEAPAADAQTAPTQRAAGIGKDKI